MGKIAHQEEAMRSQKEKLEAQRVSLVKHLHAVTTQKRVVINQINQGNEELRRTGSRMPKGTWINLHQQLRELKSDETRIQNDLALIRAELRLINESTSRKSIRVLNKRIAEFLEDDDTDEVTRSALLDLQDLLLRIA